MPSLDSYVSNGQYTEDLAVLWPNGPWSKEGINKNAAAIAAMATGAPLAAIRELLALHSLGLAGKLPYLPRVLFGVGYSLVEDLGDELDNWFDENLPGAAGVARNSVGLGVNGMGGLFFLHPDGAVAIMYMGLTYEWQWSRFKSIGEFCWITLHAAAVHAGTFPAERFKRTIAELGCAGAARAFDVPDELLPEIPDDPDNPPAWLTHP
jgi:hypothetical protein